MWRLALVVALVATSFGFFAPQATAATTISVTMTLTEPAVPSAKSGECPVAPEGFCGSGLAIPLGRVSDMIDFGAGCGGTCDLRTLTFAGGSISLDEVFTDGACPGSCGGSHGAGEPASGVLTDTVVAGTGQFAGATGTLVGSVKAAGKTSQVKLSGAITL
jgi:hypothetical protein